jgi:hypothetical protein
VDKNLKTLAVVWSTWRLGEQMVLHMVELTGHSLLQAYWHWHNAR